MKQGWRSKGQCVVTSGNYIYTFYPIPILTWLFGIYKLKTVYHS